MLKKRRLLLIITTKNKEKLVKLATQKNITIQKVGKSEGDLFKISNEFEISVKKLVTYNKLWFKNYLNGEK